MAITRDEYEFITRFRAEALNAAQQAEDALIGMGNAGDDAAEGIDHAAAAMETAQQVVKDLASFTASAYASFQIMQGSLGLFMELEDQLISVAKVTDLTDSEVQDLGKSFQQMAYDAGLPLDNFTAVAEIAGQLGIQGVQNIGDFSAAMVELGGASNLASEEAAITIARMLGVTGESIDQARTLASVLVELGNNVKANEQEIAARAQEITLATAAFGMSTTDATALGAAMAELGLRAETSGTAVGRVFIEMSMAAVEGGDKARKFAAAMGMTVAEFKRVQEADPTQLFNRFLESLSKLDQNDIIETMSGLGIINAETAKTLVPLITGYDRLAEVQKLANDEAADATALQEEAARAAESLSRQYAGLQEGLRAELVGLGELLAPIAQMLIDIAKFSLEAFNGMPQLVQDTIAIMALLAPTVIAGSLALKGLVAILGFMLPATVANAAAGGALSASLLGMGAAGRTAGAGLAVARLGLTALMGPVGIAIAAVTAGSIALAYALRDNGATVDELDTALGQAESSMDAFAIASQKAAEEQGGLRAGISAATEEMLRQSRAALQSVREDLETGLAGTLRMRVEDGDAKRVIGQIKHSLEELEIKAELNPNLDGYQEVINGLSGLVDGTTSFDQFRDTFQSIIGVGDEALQLIMDYRNGFEDGGVDVEALTRLIKYAQTTGEFAEELEHIKKMSDAGMTDAALLGISDLASEMEDAVAVSEDLRDILPEAFIEILESAADAEVKLAAVYAELQGNHDLAKKIISTGNPFAEMTDGANALKIAVDSANTKMMEAYKQYGQLREQGRQMHDVPLNEAANRGMLDLIAAAEGTDKGDGYNETLDYGRWTGGDVDLINMTIKQVLELQSKMRTPANRALYGDGKGSSAVGRYQIVSTTLRSLVDDLGLSGNERFDSSMQDRMAMELLRRREGQGVEGLRNEWEGFNRVSDSTLRRGMMSTEVSAVDSGVARQQAEDKREQIQLNEESLRQMKEEAEARADLLEAGETSISAAQLELDMIGKTTAAQAAMRAEYELLAQAKRDGINVDEVISGRNVTYRQEIEATAEALGRLAVQEERAGQAAEAAAAQKEFYNSQQQQFEEGITSAIIQGGSLIDVLGRVAESFAQAALQAALFGSGPAGGGGGGLFSGLFGSLFGGASKILGGATTANAKGNVFTQSATVPMAMFAEAGAEALMPLTRTGDGTLGVKALGASAPGAGMNINYSPTFIFQDGSSTQSEGSGADNDSFSRMLDAEVTAKVNEILIRESKPGGMLNSNAKPYGS